MGADFLERVRRPGFLVTLGVTLWAAYLFLPPNGARYETFDVAHHRGVYGSAWVGAAVSLLASAFLSLAGFYLVKNAIERDRATGVGQILATTTLSKPLYTVGKAASNFAVLATMTLLLASGALGMQLLRAEDTRIDVVALLAPFVVVTLPTLVVVSALAVAFESVRWLRGGLGNTVYFFLWVFMLAGSGPLRREGVAGIGDFLGMTALLPSIVDAVAAAFPGVNPDSAGVSLGINFTAGRGAPLQTFDWSGAHFSAAVLAGRLTWAAAGLAIALAASIPFDRFEAAVAPVRRRMRAPSRRRAPRTPFVEALDEPTSTEAGAITAATELPAAQRSPAIVSLVRGEVALALGGLPVAWWLLVVGLWLACWIAPLPVARGYLLPFAWVWPLLVWSPLGARESQHRTEALLFSSPRPLARQLAAAWIAGAFVAVSVGCGVGVRQLFTGDAAGAVAWLVGALFIPTLALACGVWTGSGRMFEVMYLMLWYVGPMNHTPALDFAATQPASLAAGAPGRFAAATLGLAAAAVLGRARRLRG
jgi:hypothetical protein